jgi:predicted TPR repeat methyltransferase
MLAHMAGNPSEAMALMRESLERMPDQADWHSNLGIVQQSAGDLEGATASFERALALDPSHVNAHNNLGVLHRIFGRHAEAEAAYRKAIELNPADANAYQNLAILMDVMGRTPEAIQAYSRALTLRPYHPSSQRRLALAYCLIGERQKAVQVCAEWVAAHPEDPQAHHMLAACSRENVPLRASDGYVQAAFDAFADSFDAKLAQLHYKAPALVADSLGASGVSAVRSLDVLDAGCGTGLCGAFLAPYARRLVGVDLSAGMLARAREKAVYDELVHEELTGYLSRATGAFDVIVSADTLVYFGALEAVIGAAAAALRPGGVMVFTLEKALAEDPGETYAIQPHGRYTHHAVYVERLLAAAGLQAAIEDHELRTEAGLPVAGLVVRAVKPPFDPPVAEAGGAMSVPGESHV